MDLQQGKLSNKEWESIEIPVSSSEKEVLDLIKNGMHDVNLKSNKTLSLTGFLKLENNETIENYLYKKYLMDLCNPIEKKIKELNLVGNSYKPPKILNNTHLNSADKIRIERNDMKSLQKQDIFEFILLKIVEKILNNVKKEVKFHNYYYTLHSLLKSSVVGVNRHIKVLSQYILGLFEKEISLEKIIFNSDSIIEKNSLLLKYEDLSLYNHQKEIFTLFNHIQNSKVNTANLVLYTAPTGTGKTLTPIGLSEKYKVIFLCAARHVGLALAKNAISCGKKIAFAFGCTSVDNIRLHNYAAKDYVKRDNGKMIVYKGGNRKIDNTNGENVEIMICDILSFKVAMHYMRAFNRTDEGKDINNNILVYWDEPTITLDYETHEFHKIIQDNWSENLIPNIVLSSATLPNQDEIMDTINDFRQKFNSFNVRIHNINSYDCKKTIPIIDKNGFVILPHTISGDFSTTKTIANHCLNNLTLLRYFDLSEVIRFIKYMLENKFVTTRWQLSNHFTNIDSITMSSIKIYYINILANILQGTWGAIYLYFKTTKTPRIHENKRVDTKGNVIKKSASIGPGSIFEERVPTSYNEGEILMRTQSVNTFNDNPNPIVNGTSGIYISTKDAYTLTDGPTIYMTDEISKIANFCIQQAQIPSFVMEEIYKKFTVNNKIIEKIEKLESELDYETKQIESKVGGGKDSDKSTKQVKKINKDFEDDINNKNSNLYKLTTEINKLRGNIKTVLLNEAFIPNKPLHLKKWGNGDKSIGNCFTSDINETEVSQIMDLSDIDTSYKILLMMGIGVFVSHKNLKFIEIMKNLAENQKLYMIIASSDYIYGTNYQFCHGFIGKDLNLTQEKVIQAMGRIGRTKLQQDYTVRFRDENLIKKLFDPSAEKPEAINMNNLFKCIPI